MGFCVPGDRELHVVGITATFFFKEAQFVRKPRSLRQAVVEPFTEFVGRNQWGGTASIILLMVLYKLGDNMAVALQTPFFIDMGYSLTAIGHVAKDRWNIGGDSWRITWRCVDA